jgi:hypothetical protein
MLQSFALAIRGWQSLKHAYAFRVLDLGATKLPVPVLVEGLGDGGEYRQCRSIDRPVGCGLWSAMI